MLPLKLGYPVGRRITVAFGREGSKADDAWFDNVLVTSSAWSPLGGG